MENYFLYAQIFGAFAFALTIWRFQLKNSRSIILCDIPVGTLWSFHYFLMNSHAALIISSLGILRSLLVFIIPEQYIKYVIGIYLTVLTAIIITTSSNLFDIVALTSVYIYGLAFLYRDNRPIMVRLMLIHYIPWIIYNTVFFSFFVISAASVGMASVIIGMYRHENWNLNNSSINFLKLLFMIPPSKSKEVRYV